MDQNLFKKHLIQIDKQKEHKHDVISLIETITGIQLEEQQVHITKKHITLSLSSVMQSKILTTKLKNGLQEKGYTLQ